MRYLPRHWPSPKPAALGVNRIRLTARADSGLKEIFVFGVERFGERQARKYLGELEDVFHLLAGNPRMGASVPDIGAGIRRHVHRSHIILYEDDGDYILVHAIVHGSSVRRMKL